MNESNNANAKTKPIDTHDTPSLTHKLPVTTQASYISQTG